jgi:nucleotide-binding universal stress UspA family protein
VRTIVVGVDGSEPSLRALDFAVGLASDLDDAELVVAFARFVYLAMPDHVAEDMYAEVLDQAEATVQAEVERALRDRELRWKFVSREGEPSHVLCDVAEEVGASFVVVGRRGWSTATELLLGSVSHRLVHRSGCPVLLITD